MNHDLFRLSLAARLTSFAFAAVMSLGMLLGVNALSTEIAADRNRPVETPYYELWLAAAEKLMTQQGLVEDGALGALRESLRSAQSNAGSNAHHHDHDHESHDHDHSHHHHRH